MLSKLRTVISPKLTILKWVGIAVLITSTVSLFYLARDRGATISDIRSDKDKLDRSLIKMTAERDVLQVEVNDLKTKIRVQNESIDAMSRETAIRQAVYQRDLKAAKERLAVNERRMDQILSRSPTGDDCGDARKLFDDYLSGEIR